MNVWACLGKQHAGHLLMFGACSTRRI
jgi:hypothetical protein